ncbi:hypothetical protein DOTSEDRAFT_75622 [Dothistroma septosporum NZE10]|uniref:Uncharacterized protein n=1 Tax=Dothistroma septosporum (strain NZE10 / CBS 128990) TaxID=675120 RepID=M2XHQ6_DOTSN|nr:hypothetical protein DOTSEDRAFT_75622 [Dothistroma septosporum NZE10]
MMVSPSQLHALARSRTTTYIRHGSSRHGPDLIVSSCQLHFWTMITPGLSRIITDPSAMEWVCVIVSPEANDRHPMGRPAS